VHGPFFLAESAVNGTSYLDMMQERLMTLVEGDGDDFKNK
jgi:hypothetical protein